MTLAEIEALRAKGWKFDFSSDPDGWSCVMVNRLAHGDGRGNTLEESADWAMKMAGAMEDDPQVLIKAHGPALLELARKFFGEDVVKGIEPLDSCEWNEPVHIAISVEPKVGPKAYVDQEVAFLNKMIEDFPREVWQAIIMEVDYADEK